MLSSTFEVYCSGEDEKEIKTETDSATPVGIPRSVESLIGIKK